MTKNNNIKDALIHEYSNKPIGDFPQKLIDYLVKIICWIIRNHLPFPYINNFNSPNWKLVHSSNEL